MIRSLISSVCFSSFSRELTSYIGRHPSFSRNRLLFFPNLIQTNARNYRSFLLLCVCVCVCLLIPSTFQKLQRAAARTSNHLSFFLLLTFASEKEGKTFVRKKCCCNIWRNFGGKHSVMNELRRRARARTCKIHTARALLSGPYDFFSSMKNFYRDRKAERKKSNSSQTERRHESGDGRVKSSHKSSQKCNSTWRELTLFGRNVFGLD